MVKLALGGPVRESNMGIPTRRRAAHDEIDAMASAPPLPPSMTRSGC